MPTFSDVLTAVGAFVIGGGFIGAIGAGAVWLSRTVSEKWLNARFEERLAAFKHEQQKELERLKGEINTEIDRINKLRQRELEALPEAWRRLAKAYGFISAVVSRMQSTPDLNRMQAEELEEFLASSEFADWQRNAIRNAEDKTGAYREHAEPFKLARAKKSSRKFYVFFRSNGIFIRARLRTRFEALDQMLVSALSERQMNFQHGTRSFVAIDKLASEGEALYRELEADVESYLWGDAKATTTEKPLS